MKKRYIIALIVFLLSVDSLALTAQSRWFYELRTYRFTTSEQQQRTEKYLQTALLPALHRANIKKAGVFKPIETDSTFGKVLIVLIPFRSLNEFEKLDAVLDRDKQYYADGKEYIDAPYDNPPYARMEKILLK